MLEKSTKCQSIAQNKHTSDSDHVFYILSVFVACFVRKCLKMQNTSQNVGHAANILPTFPVKISCHWF